MCATQRLRRQSNCTSQLRVAPPAFTAHYLRFMKSIALVLLAATAAHTQKPAVLPLMSAPPKAIKVEPRAVVALPNYDEVTATRLQIFLDNNDFGPGKIDGEMGEFFRKALLAYKRAHLMPLRGTVDQWLLDQVPEPFTTFTIPPEALNFVGPVSNKPSEQSKLKGLKYGSLLELVAERFHSAEDYLRKLNRPMNLDELKPGDTVKVPNVLPFKIEDLREGFAQPNPAFANRIVYVDTKERFLLIYDQQQLVAEFPITPGSTKLPAPIGVWKILGIATLPVFRHDEGVLQHGVVSDNYFNLPPGPNNPVGILWMGLNKPHVGIHGTNQPETIGRAASHGCIRTANWDAARVRELVTVGNTVSIF
ncbi:MAG: murein L,D-transpeptidase [Chthoniobacterales bacterium]|nr:MAG: murein L,D-transpeptidase [Chthoniobacterales bacterium]